MSEAEHIYSRACFFCLHLIFALMKIWEISPYKVINNDSPLTIYIYIYIYKSVH